MLVGTINIAMQASTQALVKGLDSARSSLGGFAKSVVSLKGLITGSFAGAGIAALGHFAGLADDLSDNIERLQTFFGSASDSIVAQAEKMNTAFGTSEITFTAMATKMGGLFKSMGVAEGPAAEMTKQLLTMGQAIAQFKGVSLEQAMGKLQAGMAGKGKGLKEFGISVSATMSAQERFNAIMSGGANILGTMDQRAMDAGASWASFKGRVEELEISLGKNLPELVEPFFAELNVLVVAAGDAFKSLKQTTLDWGEGSIEAAKSAAEGMGWVQKSIGLVADAGQVIALSFAGIQAAVLSSQTALVDAVNYLIEKFTSIPQMLTQAFNTMLGGVRDALNYIGSWLEPMLRPIADLISGKVGTQMGQLGDVLKGMEIPMPAAGGKSEFMTAFGDNLHDAANKAWAKFQTDLARPAASEGINAAFDAAHKKIQDARQEVTKSAMGAIKASEAKNIVKDVGKAAGAALAAGGMGTASVITKGRYEIGDKDHKKKLEKNGEQTNKLLADIQKTLEAGDAEPEMWDYI